MDKVGDLGEYNNIPYEIDWSLCLQQPRKKANEIYDQVLEVTRKELEQSGGLENKIAALREEAARKYKLIKKGQTVNVTFLRSGKISTTLKGRLMNLSADRLQVGGQFIRRADLPAEIQALFYEDSRQKAMENYVAERREEVDRKFLLLLKQRMEENLPPAMLKNGYVPSLRFGSLKGSLYLLENWIPMKERIHPPEYHPPETLQGNRHHALLHIHEKPGLLVRPDGKRLDQRQCKEVPTGTPTLRRKGHGPPP